MPAQGLPELLHGARERKGVDLYRAERDTKIRARYLAALERGDYRDLPGSVYTAGFLRNYALYLGLNPEEILGMWRRDRGDHARAEPAIVVRRNLPTPAKALTVSPSVVVAGLMVMVVIALAIYLAVQLLRFAKPPFLEVLRPATALIEADESDTKYLVQGRSATGATVTVTTPGREQPYRTTASPDGTWSILVELRRGQNKFEVAAVDPETGRAADETRVIQITVPFLAVNRPTLTVGQPVDGTTYENGAIPVEGTSTNAAGVVVTAVWLAPPGSTVNSTPVPSGSIPGIAPLEMALKDDRSFASLVVLTSGRWSITITATSPEGKSAALSRKLTVAYRGVILVVSIKNQTVWLKVWVDGVLDPTLGAAGKTIAAGKSLTFTGQRTIEVRTGSAGNATFTLNGTNIGALGKVGIPETWLFEPPNAPLLTKRQ